MVAHIHAALMAEYAKDSLGTQEAYLSWERKEPVDRTWKRLYTHPAWSTTTLYRRTVKTIKIGEREVKAPLRLPPHEGRVVYYSTLMGQSSFIYTGSDYHQKMLSEGMLFESMSDCLDATDAILELLKGPKCSNG